MNLPAIFTSVPETASVLLTFSGCPAHRKSAFSCCLWISSQERQPGWVLGPTKCHLRLYSESKQTLLVGSQQTEGQSWVLGKGCCFGWLAGFCFRFGFNSSACPCVLLCSLTLRTSPESHQHSGGTQMPQAFVPRGNPMSEHPTKKPSTLLL